MAERCLPLFVGKERAVEELRVSVRELVEFTLHGADIRLLSGRMQDMLDGTLGHQARQKLLGEAWQAEVPLTLAIPCEDEELTLLLAGRMDAFRDAMAPEIPCVEEIKLWQGEHPPEAPLPAHRMQAVCYGHMLCQTRGLSAVDVRVVYVTRRGKVQGEFAERLTAEACQAEFQTVLLPYLRRVRAIRRHTRARNASLAALKFPYDTYRPGQREMAVQVYTAIRRRKRLFACMPTGTGKSSATLFPALKALGEGLTAQVYYLTARTTQRQGALDALSRLHRQTLHLWALVIDAKEKQCPTHTLCHPDYCERAKGHFLRDTEAIEAMMQTDDWSAENVRAMADQYGLCPFEFAMSLCEIADVVICDYNYALDPAVHIRRIFDATRDVTLLIDEAHHLPERIRGMLSGTVDSAALRKLRTVVGKAAGRKHPLYQAMTDVIREVDNLPIPEGAEEGVLPSLPDSFDHACLTLADAFLDARQEHFPWEEAGTRLSDTLLPLLSFNRARQRDAADYAILWQGYRHPRITAFALDAAGYFQQATQGLSGVTCFSATLHPLREMRLLLGGTEEDACFAMPSPFPPEHLEIRQVDVNTRYQHRQAACTEIARQITALVTEKPGKYLVFFPSFLFLRMTAERLMLPCQVQEKSMDEAARAAFLAAYRQEQGNVLGLCVLGGVFAEGIDLPGKQLDGVVVVGVGLPQVNLFQETLRAHYERTLGNGFFYAYMLPGMQKVTQAVGRVIRTETDRGVALLLDDRYKQVAYRRLMPEHWRWFRP